MKLTGNQRGFTLIELLVVIGIMGAISGVMSMTVIMIMKVAPESNNQAVVLSQVQNAGYWISRDVQRAQNIDIDVTDPNFLILTWTDWDYSGGESSTWHVVTYSLEEPDTVKKLMRRYQDNVGTDEQILIAQDIYYDPVGDPTGSTQIIAYDSPTLTLRITATSSGKTATRVYEASRRPTF